MGAASTGTDRPMAVSALFIVPCSPAGAGSGASPSSAPRLGGGTPDWEILPSLSAERPVVGERVGQRDVYTLRTPCRMRRMRVRWVAWHLTPARRPTP